MRIAEMSGQVVVEMALILPVFLMMVFFIMEIGYLSFRLIVLNHAVYEVARVGGMTCAYPSWSGACSALGQSKIHEITQRILPAAVSMDCKPEYTLTDVQAGQANYDLVCTGQEDAKLVFPLSSILLAQPPGSGHRILAATVRMPIEQPLRK